MRCLSLIIWKIKLQGFYNKPMMVSPRSASSSLPVVIATLDIILHGLEIVASDVGL
jgi:hypothetical protein